jgi:hypothetical protein
MRAERVFEGYVQSEYGCDGEQSVTVYKEPHYTCDDSEEEVLNWLQNTIEDAVSTEWREKPYRVRVTVEVEPIAEGGHI